MDALFLFQLEIYKQDFEAERAAREKLVGEKDSLMKENDYLRQQIRLFWGTYSLNIMCCLLLVFVTHFFFYRVMRNAHGELGEVLQDFLKILVYKK